LRFDEGKQVSGLTKFQQDKEGKTAGGVVCCWWFLIVPFTEERLQIIWTL